MKGLLSVEESLDFKYDGHGRARINKYGYAPEQSARDW